MLFKRFASTLKKGIKLNAMPFKISSDEARQILSQNEGLLEFNIKDSNDKFSGKLEKAFFPMHCASIQNINTKYFVKYGIDRTEWRTEFYTVNKQTHVRQVPYTVTDWYSLHGTTTPTNYGANDMMSFHKYADFEYPTDFVEQIVPTIDITEKCEEIVSSGEKIYSHEKKMSFAIDQIFDTLRSCEKNRLISIIKQQTNADHVDVKSMNLIMDRVEILPYSYYAPIYLYETQVENETRKICKIINGHTGKYAGDYVVSELKFGITGAVIGGLVGFASFFVFPVYGPIARFVVLRVGLSGAVSALLSAIGSKLYSEYKYDDMRKTLNVDKEANTKHEETLEDIQLKALSGKSIKHDYIMFLKEFDILGLDIEDELTIEILKIAKIKKIKQYHPDLNHPSKKETCNILTDQVLNAYQKLERIVKK